MRNVGCLTLETNVGGLFPFYELSRCNSKATHDPKHISFFTLSLLFVNAEHVAQIWIAGLFSWIFPIYALFMQSNPALMKMLFPRILGLWQNKEK